MKLQQSSNVVYTEVKGHIAKAEQERATAMLEVDRRITTLAVEIKELQDHHSNLQQKTVRRLDTLSEQLPRVAPVEIIMPKFEQHKRDDDEWYSDGFYAHRYCFEGSRIKCRKAVHEAA